MQPRSQDELRVLDDRPNTAWQPLLCAQVLVNGFVSNMHEWMGACDAIITKAGPGTIAESMICGLPTVLNAFVPCQEEGNISFVTDNGVGVFETKVDKAAETISRWFSDPALLQSLAAKARKLGFPKATFRIAEDLVSLIRLPVMVPA